jgi:hypothetical protein
MIVFLISLTAFVVSLGIFLKGRPNLFMFQLIEDVFKSEDLSDSCERVDFSDDQG